MKKSELIKIIKEEVVNVLSEMPLITKKGKVVQALNIVNAGLR